MKKILAAIFVLAAAAALHAEEGKGAVSRYQCVDLKGDKLWEAAVTTTPIIEEKDGFLTVEEGKGRYHGFKGITSRRYEMHFIKNKERLTPVSMSGKVFSESGKAVLELTQRFYPDRKEADYEVRNLLSGKEKKETVKYEGDIVNSMIMDAYIQRLLEAGVKKKTVYVLSDDAGLYRVTLRVIDKEEVTVNGKAREAYKISIDPEIGLLSPVKMFITKNYEWYSCEPPYEWLKFKGLESSVDSPVVEMTPLGD